MTRQALADALGISLPRVKQLKAMGMPTHCVEEAKRWRAVNTSKRAPTNGKSASGPPLPPKLRAATRRALPPALSEDPLLDILNATRMRHCEIHGLVMDAMAGGEIGSIPSLISISTKAAEAAMAAEKSYREERERRGVLVEQQPVIERCRRAIETMTQRIRRLPIESGPQCNPAEPHRALTILERAVAEVIEAGRRALLGLGGEEKEVQGR